MVVATVRGEAESMAFSGDLQDVHRIKANPYSEPILDQPEFVEVRSRLGFKE